MLARVCAGSTLALLVTLASAGSGHIDLLSPPPRASGQLNTSLDRPPCGQRRPGRVPEKVSVFRPGETITVSWDAYVQHPGYFRLSFDSEGDDSFSERTAAPADPARDDPSRLPQGAGELILDYVLDPTGALEHIDHAVTLPSEPCETCTLQLTQFVYGVPVAEATYYQCADVTLAGEPVPAPPEEPEPLEESEQSAAEAAEGCALDGPLPSPLSGSSLLLAALLAAIRSRRRAAAGPGAQR